MSIFALDLQNKACSLCRKLYIFGGYMHKPLAVVGLLLSASLANATTAPTRTATPQTDITSKFTTSDYIKVDKILTNEHKTLPSTKEVASGCYIIGCIGKVCICILQPATT